MHGDEHPQKRDLADHRERVLAGLSEAFSRDELSMDEFESRVDAAFAAANVTELSTLVEDLGPDARRAASIAPQLAVEVIAPASALSRLGVPSGNAMVVLPSVPQTVAVFGNVERAGRVAYAARNKVICVFGNVEMDLRQASLTVPMTEIDVHAVFGNVEILIPPNLTVVCDGIGVFGSFAGLHRVPTDGVDVGPVLRITGKAVFGNVEVRTLPVGTSKVARGHLALPGRT